MSKRPLILAAAAAVLSMAPSLALADAPALPPGQSPALAPSSDYSTPLSLLDTPGHQPHLLTKLVDPNDTLYKSTGIEIYGHVEGGITHNFSSPSTDQNAFRVFDFEHNQAILNQIDLSIERKVDYRKNQFDVGGLMEWIYGGDAGFIHANGIFDWYDGPRKPENQFDPVQFYADLTLPVLGGMRIRAGKFVNLVGYESINPTADFIGFYSRSYVFGSGYPFTHLGVLATFDPLKNVTVTAGVTRGDEQGFKDDNDAVSFLGSVNWVINKQLALYVSNSTGPEQPGNNSDYRTTWDATLFYQPADKWKVLGNVYYIYDQAGAANGRSGTLLAFAGLASYQICNEAAVKVRGEWFHDHDGLRTPPGTDLYEITVGLDVTPFAKDPIGRNLIIRPELRYDFSDDAVFDNEKSQFTFGVDAIFRF